MRELRNAVAREIENELARANEEWPKFRSNHEGIAVIDEEVTEARCEYVSLKEAFNELKKDVFLDKGSSYMVTDAGHVNRIAIELACEAIQVAAMGRKFIDGIREREGLE